MRWSFRVLGTVVLLLAGSGCAYAVQAGDSRERPRVTMEKSFKPGGSPGAVAWSADGKLLAVLDELNSRLTIWDYISGNKIASISRGEASVNSSLEFIENSRFIITPAKSSGSPNNTKAFSVIETNTGAPVRDVDGPAGTEAIDARIFAMSASGKFLALGTNLPRPTECLTFYDAKKWEPLYPPHCGELITALSFSPIHEQLFALHIRGSLDVWDVGSDKLINTIKVHGHEAGVLAVTKDGRFVATANGLPTSFAPPDKDPIRLWDTSTWRMIASAIEPTGEKYSAESLSFSADGRFLASLNYDGKVRLWDAKTLSLLAVADSGEHGGTAVSFSPTDNRLAIARDFKVVVLRIEGGANK